MGVDFGYSGTASQLNVRGYQSKADLNYHCDPNDIVALLCVRKALSGGVSSIVSTPAIFNERLRDHPQHLRVLLRGFPYDRKAQQSAGEAPLSERIPVFRVGGDRVSCRYARSFIQGAAQKTTPLTDAEVAALDCFDAIARRPDMPMHMSFEPGEIQLLNNFTVVHGRTAYEDHPDPALRRFLWRMWLHLGEKEPWCKEGDEMRWVSRYGNLGRTVEEWARLVAQEQGGADRPFQDLKGFLQYARGRPDPVPYGTAGVGSTAHLYMEVFRRVAKVPMVHVPYKGQAHIINDLLGGQLPAGTISATEVRQNSGKLVPLAVMGPSRSPLLPDVPTLSEAGVGGLDRKGWFGLFAPAATPPGIVDQVSHDVNELLAQSDFRTRMGTLGIVLKGSAPSAFAEVVKSDYAYWSDVIRTSNIRL